MPQTTNYGFPLWADTPPEGATGKDLRDVILGEDESSLANKVDAALKEVADGIPTKVSDLTNDAGFAAADALEGKEDRSNKLGTYNDVDGYWAEATQVKYPSAWAVYNFVQSYVGTHAVSYENFQEVYYGLIEPAAGMVPLDAAVWDGDTEGRTNLLGLFYKISDSTEQPDSFKIETSIVTTSTGEVNAQPLFFWLSGEYLGVKITALEDAFGIVAYARNSNNASIYIIVADRAGVLPAAVVEQMMGTNPGVNVPYEAGTYVVYQSDGSGQARFVSKATPYVGIGSYIDRRISETLAVMGGNAE